VKGVSARVCDLGRYLLKDFDDFSVSQNSFCFSTFSLEPMPGSLAWQARVFDGGVDGLGRELTGLFWTCAGIWLAFPS